ncbi:TIGR01459 family HAD-type hydrolase [Halovulum dunhuangense]|uniref:TIGR01459 family HAD-type hydrolase n=1 Tax=Halovulum dunhuangense TaxID=1505036 RepID=A0A849KR22_9RHOB|nr:TIGR01459 family HAD-type hydrolase [Halovulum dunhuangense]NNU79523.1 TIGR01459 family HAD-type hydrolase [Halovulum dunhuangense]
MNQTIPALDAISDRYDVLFCDLWGCLHNGRDVFPDAARALIRFRQGGGTVILVTNSPRPRPAVRAQLGQLGAPEECYDDIASSGDAAQAAMAAGQFGRRVFHIGPERDLVFFEDENGGPIDVTRVPLEEAEGVICTGLFDDRSETPEDYRLTLMRAKARGLKLLCANPDIVVDLGHQRIYCAGALAALYTELGGKSYYFGKPHAPIYNLARTRAETIRGARLREESILCVGDGIHTDILGGMGEGFDTLFVAGGLAAEETGIKDGQPDPEKLKRFLEREKLSPTATIGFLR